MFILRRPAISPELPIPHLIDIPAKKYVHISVKLKKKAKVFISAKEVGGV